MKKILLALALVSASSVFADAVNNMTDWFNATPDAETVKWVWTGEDGSVITNTTAETKHWEIDADVTKATNDTDATVFTPDALAEPTVFSNSVTHIEVATTFDAMYDMTMAQDDNEEWYYCGEDKPEDPPEGALGAIIIGCTTNTGVNASEDIVSSNYYAWVGVSGSQNWVKLFGHDVPHCLTGDVVNVKIEMLYMHGVNELRFRVKQSGEEYTVLTNAAGASLFAFTPAKVDNDYERNVKGVQFSGCGKVSSLTAKIRNTEYFDGGNGTEDSPYVIANADTMKELGVAPGDGKYYSLSGTYDVGKFAPIFSGDSKKINVIGSNDATINVELTGNSFFGNVYQSTFKNLTINAVNASDNDADAAVFASICGDYVEFENCIAAGHLYNSKANATGGGLLAGFVLTNDVGGAWEVSTTSATFSNCVVTVELDNGTTGDEKNYDHCYAFSGYIAKGAIMAALEDGQVAGDLATVNGYLSYGTIATAATVAQGSAHYPFCFCTNTVAEAPAVSYTRYLVPEIGGSYTVMRPSTQPFYFDKAGSVTFLSPDGLSDVQYTGAVTAHEDFVLEDSGYGSGKFYRTCSLETCYAIATDGSETTNRYTTVAAAINGATSGQTVYLYTNNTSITSFDLDADATLASGVTLDLCKTNLNVAAGKSLKIGGTLLAYKADLADIVLGEGSTNLISRWTVSGGTPCVKVNGVPWINYTNVSDSSASDASFAHLQGATEIVIRNEESTINYDFRGSSGTDEKIYVHLAKSALEAGTFNIGSDVKVKFDASGVDKKFIFGMLNLMDDVVPEPDYYGLKFDSDNFCQKFSAAAADVYYCVDWKACETLEDALAFVDDGESIEVMQDPYFGLGLFDEEWNPIPQHISSAATFELYDYVTNTVIWLAVDANVKFSKTVDNKFRIGYSYLWHDPATSDPDELWFSSGLIQIKAGCTLDLSSFSTNDIIFTTGSDPTGVSTEYIPAKIDIAAGATLVYPADVNPTDVDSNFTFVEGSKFKTGSLTYTWNGENWTLGDVCQIVTGTTTNKYSTLAAAVAAATSGDTIQMIDNVSYEVNNGDAAYLNTIPGTKSITLDLNGKTISAAYKTGYTTSESVLTIINIASGGELIIDDSTTDKNGAIRITESPDFGTSKSVTPVYVFGATLTVNAGTLENLSSAFMSFAVDGYNPDITINGGTFNSPVYTAIRVRDGAEIVINGGTFTGKRCFYLVENHNNGTLTINGGSFTAWQQVFHAEGSAVEGTDNIVNIKGGTFALDDSIRPSGASSDVQAIFTDGSGSSAIGKACCNIYGGTFTAGTGAFVTDTHNIFVVKTRGGTYDKETAASGYLASDNYNYKANVTPADTWSVYLQYMWQIAGAATKYGDLQSAIDAATADDTIQLLEDATVSGLTATYATVAASTTRNIDWAGKTLTFDGNWPVASMTFFLVNGNLTLTNSVGNGGCVVKAKSVAASSGDDQNWMFSAYGNIVFNGGTYVHEGDGSYYDYIVTAYAQDGNKQRVTINGGTFTAGDTAFRPMVAGTAGTGSYDFIMNGGTVNAKRVIFLQGTGENHMSWTQNGGTVNAESLGIYIMMKKYAAKMAEITINGGTINIGHTGANNSLVSPYLASGETSVANALVINITGGEINTSTTDYGLLDGGTGFTTMTLTGGVYDRAVGTEYAANIPAYAEATADSPAAGYTTVSLKTVTFTPTLGEHVTAATYTVNDGTAVSAPTTSQVKYGDVIKITNVTYDDNWVEKAPYVKDYSYTVTESDIVTEGKIDWTIEAQEGLYTVTMPSLTDTDFSAATVATNGTTIITGGATAQSASVLPNAEITITWTAASDKFFIDGTGTKVEQQTITGNTTLTLPTAYGILPIDESDSTRHVGTINNLLALRAGIAGGKYTATDTFTLTTDIDMSTAGAWVGFGTDSNPFTGTFDGNGKRIYNLTLAKLGDSYKRGFFDVVCGGTIKNLTVETLGFDSTDTETEKYGGGTLVGFVNGGVVVSNVTTKGTLNALYTAGGMVGAVGYTTPVVTGVDINFYDSTNEVALTGVYDKHGGFIGYLGYTGDNADRRNANFIRCRNTGSVTVNLKADRSQSGVSDFIGYSEVKPVVTFVDCTAEGTLVLNNNETATEQIGAFIGHLSSNAAGVIGLGTNVANSAKKSIGTDSIGTTPVSGLNFATVASEKATYVVADAIEAGGTYTVMRDNDLDFELDAKSDGTSTTTTFNLNGNTYTGAVTTDTNVNTLTTDSTSTTITYTTTVKPATESVFEVTDVVSGGKDAGTWKGSTYLDFDAVKTLEGCSGYQKSDMTGTTLETVQGKLNTKNEANNIPEWQNIVLGYRTKDRTPTATDKPTTAAVQDTSAGKITVKLGGFDETAATAAGATVYFTRIDDSGNEIDTSVNSQIEINLADDFKGGTKVKHYKFRVVIDQANLQKVETK